MAKAQPKPIPIAGEPVEELFAAFGGLSKFASAIDAPISTAFSWKKNGIPRWRMRTIKDAARARKVALPASILEAA